jgi:hypothetical protein
VAFFEETRQTLVKMNDDAKSGKKNEKERSKARSYFKCMKKLAEEVDANCKAYWKSSTQVISHRNLANDCHRRF